MPHVHPKATQARTLTRVPLKHAAPVNDAPVPADKSFTTREDTPLRLTRLLDGITDADAGDTFKLLNASAPAHGNLTALDADGGSVTYTPGADFNGRDSFNYTVADAGGATGSARVDITVGARPAARANERAASKLLLPPKEAPCVCRCQQHALPPTMMIKAPVTHTHVPHPPCRARGRCSW